MVEQVIWRMHLHNPVLHVVIVVSHVKENLAVRIGPGELRYSAFRRHRFGVVVSGNAVVREQRGRKRSEREDQANDQLWANHQPCLDRRLVKQNQVKRSLVLIIIANNRCQHDVLR